MINIWFKFEDKIQNTSKVIMFTRNHTDDRTKNNMSSPGQGGGGDIIILESSKLPGRSLASKSKIYTYMHKSRSIKLQ